MALFRVTGAGAAGPIPGSGRMAIAADPTGAVFGMWEAAGHPGSEVVNELVSPDLPAARTFYAAALGVEWGEEETAPGEPYGLLQVGGRSVGGAIPARDGLPPHWGLYFEVADTDAAVGPARELGAEVVLPVMPTPQGPMATLRDPQGGTFSVIASGSAE